MWLLCHSAAFLRISATIQSAEITHSTLIFTAVNVMQNHNDSRKSRHTTKIRVKVTTACSRLRLLIPFHTTHNTQGL